VEVERVAEGLWLWRTADGEGRTVTSVYLELGASIVLVDPLVPAEPDEAERFWRALDRDVERAGLPPAVVLTSNGRRRSADEIARRYGSPAHPAIETIPVSADESAFWLPAHRMLVAGRPVSAPPDLPVERFVVTSG
jgi:hypothetical protein